MRELRTDYSLGMAATVLLRIFCYPVSYIKAQGLKYKNFGGGGESRI
jgi:hypothetical protein